MPKDILDGFENNLKYSEKRIEVVFKAFWYIIKKPVLFMFNKIKSIFTEEENNEIQTLKKLPF